MKLIWIFIFSGQFLQFLGKEVTYKGVLKTKENSLAPAYLIGSRWAITMADPLYSYHNDEVYLEIEQDHFLLDEIKLNNLSTLNNVSINFALVKLNRPADKHGAAVLFTDYPEEWSKLYSVANYQHSYETTTYTLCQHHFGYVVGVFCITNVTGYIFTGRAIFIEDMLAGLTAGVETEGVHLVTAIAPAMRWITDTMSEIIYRRTP